MSASSSSPRLIASLDAILDDYDAIICDVWGVLHNGIKVWPAAQTALARARQAGKTVVMLTNAPRRAEDVAGLIYKIGGNDSAWNSIVSSGAVTTSLMAERGNAPFYHLGPERDVSIFENLSARSTPLEDADYVLCTGFFDDETETPENYRGTLEKMLAKKLPMICANPDLVVERGHRLIPCAGAMADVYEKMGGPVIWVGKPHPLVYQRAKAEIERVAGRTIEKSRILGIGDALRTDITGAIGFGIDCLMVLDGIHADVLGLRNGTFSTKVLDNFLAEADVTPRYAIKALTWS